MISESLAQYLSSHADLQQYVGGARYKRVFPMLIPQHVLDEETKLPCVVYQIIDSSPGYTLCGEDGLQNAVFQLDSYSTDEEVSRKLAAAIKKVLSNFSGLMFDTHVSRIFLESGFQILEPDPGLFRVSQSYSVWFIEEE